MLHYFSKKRKFSGQMFLMYCTWYGFGRAFIELLRTDSLMLGAHVRVSSLLSFILCITAATLLTVFMRKVKSASGNDEYIKVFADEEEETEEIILTQEKEND